MTNSKLPSISDTKGIIDNLDSTTNLVKFPETVDKPLLRSNSVSQTKSNYKSTYDDAIPTKSVKDTEIVIDKTHSTGSNSNWFFWQNLRQEATISSNSQNVTVATWSDWFDTLPSYIYRKSPEIISQIESESTPNASKSANAGNWFSWIWNSIEGEEEDYENYTNDVKLYKESKNAIENSKDTSCFAYKGILNSHFLINDHELAVYGTSTETQPVKYNIKKTPILPAEVQENSIQMSAASKTTSFSKLLSPLSLNHTLGPNISGSSPKLSSSASIISNDNTTIIPNEVIPDINENFRTITLLTKLRLFGQGLVFHQKSSENHLYRTSRANIIDMKINTIKKVVIIGIHGFLPPKFVKNLIGQPTGSSIKFIREATKAIKDWLEDIDEPGFENMYNIDTIALEGQGTIEERVERSLKLLANWKGIINECDFLFIVGHGQGSLIGIKLLAQLLQTNMFKVQGKKIGLLSMAGPLLGPIKNLDTKIVVRAYSPKENEVLNELIQYQDVNSVPFQELDKSLEYILQANVKVTLAGSFNDQLIPLHSALGNNLYHPNIFRCIFVDSNCQVPLFIITLCKLILFTRNLGHLELGLFQNLSERCIGNYGDGTFGKIFNDEDIYLTSIKFALESTKLNQSKDLQYISHHNDSLTSSPTLSTDYLYQVPWSLRELIQDILQTKHLNSVNLIKTLLMDYQPWEPTKAWKDYKYALESLADIDPYDLFVSP